MTFTLSIRKPLAAIAALALASSLVLHPTPSEAAAIESAALERTLRDRLSSVVGSAATGASVVVTQGGSRLIALAQGHADAALTEPLTLETRTPVASISKVPTALAAIALDAEGLLDLSSDLSATSGVDMVDVRPEADRSTVTGWNALTHHAGFSESVLLLPGGSPGQSESPSMTAWLEQHPPVLRHASVGLHYSPLQAHAVVGVAIEEATGMTFDEAVARHIFDAVGANDASYRSQAGDAEISAPAGDGWTPTPWPDTPERPAAGLMWSTEDAEAMLLALSPASDALPESVRTRALTTAVRPAHGGTGHTGVFFDEVRIGTRVLEHVGANGVARLAYIPEADTGIYVATTSDQPEAGEITEEVIDDVVRWTRDSALRGEQVAGPRAPIAPSWTASVSVASPKGLFAERLFLDRPFERALRALIGQVRVNPVGDDLRIGDQVYALDSPGRWCAAEGCVLAVKTDAGDVQLLRGDRGMLEQTLDAVPWWRSGSLALAGLALIPLLGIITAASRIRAAVLRRRGATPRVAPSRVLAGAWAATAFLAVLGAVMLPLLPMLDAQTFPPLSRTSPALLAVAATGVVAVILGLLWTISALRASRARGISARCVTYAGILLGIAATMVVVDWTVLPPWV